MSEAKLFPNGCVASPHYLASAAGLAVLASGGNALDAAVATNLTLGVVAPYMCGYGGDLFAIVSSDGIHGYNGSGRAPAGANLDAARRAAGADRLPARGPLTVTVPGAVEAWFALLERFGTRSFADLASAAHSYAVDGFPLTKKAAGYIGASAAAFTGSWAEAWHETYRDTTAGDRLCQPALARTIERLGRDGPDAYYRGPIGEAIADMLRSNGAFMTPDDLAEHNGDWVEPLSTSYRDVDIYELPPNTQGVAALEAMNLLERFEPDPSTGLGQHLLVEATKIALSDRDAYITDRDHMRIDPAEIAGKPWAHERVAEIDVERTSSPSAGRVAAGGTIYLCAADADGMLVSLIQSNYMGFGSGVTVPEWGINLQNRGAYFSLDREHANVIAPRKRTMHTLMPGMAFRGSEPWLVFGAMGGDGQAQTHVQFLSRVIDGGADIQEAISAPRWVVSPNDWTLRAESRFGSDMIDGLRSRGHDLETIGPYETDMGHAHAIEIRDHDYAAATDPRAEGAALGL